MAIGIGAGASHVDVALVAVAMLGLASRAASGGPTSPATTSAPSARSPRIAGRERPRTALDAFGYAHFPLLLGIIFARRRRQERRSATRRPARRGRRSRSAGGAALFLARHVAFRRILRIAGGHRRAFAVPLLLATIPLGLLVSGAAQLGVLAAVFAGALAAER